MSRRQKHTIDRVTYYGPNDATVFHNLKKAEKLIRIFNPETRLSVNDILELYHTQLLFDTDYRLKEWKEKDWKFYKKEVQKFDSPIRDFFISLNDENLIGFCDEITGFRYRSSFWKLFNKFNCQKKISLETIGQLLRHHPFNYKDISQFKKLVKCYEKPLINYIEENPIAVEHILTQKEGVNNSKIRFFLPKSLSNVQMNSIIDKYLDSKGDNLNYLGLIINSSSLELAEEVKFKASKLYKKNNQELFKKFKGVSMIVEVGIAKDQEEPVRTESVVSESLMRYTYSRPFLEATLDPFSIFNNFVLLFKFLSFQGCVDLVYQESDKDIYKYFGVSSKNEYPKNVEFIYKKMASDKQLYLYRHFLKMNDVEIEEVIKEVAEEVFSKIFDIKLNINIPNIDSKPWEKFRVLAPELDSILKQYKMFAEKGEIDMDFVRFQSKPPYFSKLSSRLSKKYVYAKGEEFLKIGNLLFSSQSYLVLSKKMMELKYKNFLDLITKEKVAKDDFSGNEQKYIDALLLKDILYIDPKGFLKIADEMKTVLLFLYYQGVINYYHFPLKVRELIDKLEKAKLVEFDNGLFTRPEIDYFNYYLNKRRFTNGYDLRNKYMHGSNSESENQQQTDYNALLKIFILILLKIYDDLYLTKKNELR